MPFRRTIPLPTNTRETVGIDKFDLSTVILTVMGVQNSAGCQHGVFGRINITGHADFFGMIIIHCGERAIIFEADLDLTETAS